MNIISMQTVSNFLQVRQQCKDARAMKEQSSLASIRNILMQGKELSADEMDYLQRHDPNLHDQAMTISIERQAYEDALQHSRSKADAKDYNMFKVMQIAGQLKYDGSEELLMRSNAIQEAHRKFMRSSKYASLRSSAYASHKRQ